MRELIEKVKKRSNKKDNIRLNVCPCEEFINHETMILGSQKWLLK